MRSQPQGPENDSPAAINPYAPTIAPLERPSGRLTDIEFVSNIKLVLATIGCVAGAGGVFGFGFVVFAALVDKDPSAISFALFSTPVGVVWALAGSVVVVPVTLVASFAVRANERPWAANEIYLFGAICGFATGFCCLALPMMLRPYVQLSDLLMALVPGVVGGITTPLILIPLARRARRAEQCLRESILATEQSEQHETPNVFAN